MKAKLVLIIMLMTAIPIVSSAQTTSGVESAPANPAGAGRLAPSGPRAH